jgi:hypothetical protein
MDNKKARVIAFYLPQFHPIPENDAWWGKGFTEWTNVGKAKPLFRGHYQPKVPADLGYYDLRVPEVLEQQAQMAKEAGIEGFCYWHYWFNGKRLLERPFNEVVESGKPDFPFCLGWANHSWAKKTWSVVKKDIMLIEQTYGGKDDYINHFNEMLPAFKDKRYLKNDGKLIFLIWKPFDVPNGFIRLWNDLAKQNGLNGFYFIGFTNEKKDEDNIYRAGFDAVCLDEMHEAVAARNLSKKFIRKLLHSMGYNLPRIIPYSFYAKFYLKKLQNSKNTTIPCILPNFDHTPRSGKIGIVLSDSTPEKFAQFLRDVIEMQSERKQQPLLFLKSWNEWGEGNYLEPDIKYGNAYLKELKNVVNCQKSDIEATKKNV